MYERLNSHDKKHTNKDCYGFYDFRNCCYYWAWIDVYNAAQWD